MKNANRNILLAATAALALVVAPSALADLRVNVNLPKPPSPREVLSHLPGSPVAPVADRDRGQRYENRDRGYDSRNRWNDGRRNDRGQYDRNRNDRDRYDRDRNDRGRYDRDRNDRGRYDRGRNDGRWNYQNRDRDDRYSAYRLDRYRSGHYRRPDLRIWFGSRWLTPPFPGSVWVDGRWLTPPFPGAVWVDGYYDEYGDWIDGGWVRPW